MISVGINALAMGKELVGTGQYTYHLISSLAKIDRINEYVIIKNRCSPLNSVTSGNIQHVNFRFKSRIKRILLESILLPRIMRMRKVDIFHSPSFTIPFSVSIPTVVTIHDMVCYKFPETIDRLRRIYLANAVRCSILKADRIIAVSQSTKKDIVDTFDVPETKIDVVYEASAPCFRATADGNSVQETCKKYFIEEPFLLYVGTLEPRKNLVKLMQAYFILKRDYRIKHKLVIAGKKGWNYGPIFSEIERLSLRNDVIFTGYVPEQALVHLYNGAELFILPSLYEGFGLPILEAMACGTPVITSNISSMPEVAGDAAILVDPYDVDALAGAMHGVLTDKGLKESLVKKGLERVKHFSWKKCAEETIRVYEAACSSNKSSADYADFTD